MGITWDVSVYDFLIYSDGFVYKPAYVITSDALSFSEKLTNNYIQATILDYIPNLHDTIGVSGVHHVEFEDTMTFADEMMKGSPQLIADWMVLVDAFDVAANLIVDSFVFTDTMTGVDSLGLPDTVVFSDTFSLNFVWGDTTAGIVDSATFVDYMNSLYIPGGKLPNPWLPNYPLTTIRSDNPTCEQSTGQEGLPW